ncbi:MAG: tripartite tricarboxylate transporter substrate binding protein, partial [Burkholderiales bacterium]|nr:tripartite tricarboxylate transporter substrate binding protein [Burkholderiales bacterium]
MTSTPPLTRRRLVGSLLLAGLAPAARADSFPTRPLHLVVPFPPGGPTDLVARPLAAQLGPVLGESLIVDNRGGAGGGIGAAFVAQSPPDGYTLLMGTVGTHAINASLYQHLDYDPVADFTPLALVASAPVAVVVDARSPWKTLADLVAAARAKPKAVFFGSAG